MKPSRPRPRFAPLSLETLEGRWALSGEVLVDVSGANIKITGDGAENDISMFVDFNPAIDVIRVIGNGDTNVVIKGGDELPAPGALGNVTIDLKKGAIPVTNPPDPRGGGLGVDRVAISDLIFRNLTIKGGNGGVVKLDNVQAHKTVIDFDAGNGLSAGADGSSVEITDSVLGADLSFNPARQKGVTIATKDCRDHIEISDTALHGNVKITTKGAIDEIGLINLQGGLGVGLGIKNLTIDAGKGADLVGLSGVNVNGKSNLKTGDGDDSFVWGSRENTAAGALTLDTGAGNDTVGLGSLVDDVAFATTFGGKVSIKTGTENDRLMLGFQVFLTQAKNTLNGGKQTATDTLEVFEPFDPNNEETFKEWEARFLLNLGVNPNLQALQDGMAAEFDGFF